MLTNPLPGPPASVFRSVLATDPDHAPAPGVQQIAYFSTSNFPGLPSLVNEVVWVPAYALINANMEIDGILVSQGWATDGVTTVTSNYTAQSTDALILANATGGAITVTLPDATQTGFSPGQRYTIIKTDSSANNVTVAASAGQLIGGGATVTLTAANGYVSVAFDGITGTNWWIWATSGGGFSPTGAAGGALTGTYPNPGLATVPISSGGTGATTQQAAMNAIAGGVLSGKYLRGDGTNVVLHVINAADLPTATTSVQGAVQLDGTATDIQPDGVQAAGSSGLVPDAQHVHPTHSWLSLYTAPSGATAETFPRILVSSAASPAMTSGTLYVTAIGLPKGQLVSNLTFATKGTALATLTHGWYVLLDSGLVVRAVTADQTSGTWLSAINTAYTLAFASSYTTTAAGLYYVGIMAAATTMPALAVGPAGDTGLVSASPILAATSSTGQTTPPTTGTTMGALTANANFALYAYTS